MLPLLVSVLLSLVDHNSGQCVLSVEAGLHYTCAKIMTAGKNVTNTCWGDTLYKNRIPSGPAMSKFYKIIPGVGYKNEITSCAFKTMPPSEVTCFGVNDTTIAQTLVPNYLFLDVCVGGVFGCGIINNGFAIKCWGSNLNQQGQVPPLVSKSTLIFPKWVSVLCGYEHVCAMRDDGHIVCWGANDEGQARIPRVPTTDEFSPPFQKNAFLSNAPGWSDLSLGWYHTCGVYRKNVYCWGFNGYGQCNVPAAISGKAARVSVNYDFSCVLTLDKNVVCWGRNNRGQSGVPSSLCNAYNGQYPFYVERPRPRLGETVPTDPPPMTPPPTALALSSDCKCTGQGCVCPPLVLDFIKIMSKRNANSAGKPQLTVALSILLILSSILALF